MSTTGLMHGPHAYQPSGWMTVPHCLRRIHAKLGDKLGRRWQRTTRSDPAVHDVAASSAAIRCRLDKGPTHGAVRVDELRHEPATIRIAGRDPAIGGVRKRLHKSPGRLSEPPRYWMRRTVGIVQLLVLMSGCPRLLRPQ